MSAVVIGPLELPTAISFADDIQFSLDVFLEFCRQNPDKHIEQEANGDIIIMAPSGSETGRKNARVTASLVQWSDEHGGVVLDSSAGFRLPNGATRAPDSAWVSSAKWEAVAAEERERFPALVPEFVVEIVSPTDLLDKQKSKMEEYAANGVLLGWLLIPKLREVHIYRSGAELVEVVENPASMTADADVLPGFVLDFGRIW